MSTSFFITGTDTDVGKTYVAAALIRGLRARQLKVSGYKPVAAGAKWVNGQLQNDDALNLMKEASQKFSYQEVNPYCFEPAIAPHIAAEQMGVEVQESILRSVCAKHKLQSEVVIIEGAGGWKVPLNRTMGFDDLALSLGAPVILVVGLKLGCINHALLTEAAILAKGCQIVGWVGNDMNGNFEEIDANIATLKEQMKSRCIGYFDYQSPKVSERPVDQRNVESLLDCLSDFR
jgi:dethiobiotin synthetase